MDNLHHKDNKEVFDREAISVIERAMSRLESKC